MLIFVVHDKNVFLSINGENMPIGTRETIFYFIVHTAAFFPRAPQVCIQCTSRILEKVWLADKLLQIIPFSLVFDGKPVQALWLAFRKLSTNWIIKRNIKIFHDRTTLKNQLNKIHNKILFDGKFFQKIVR